MLFPVERESAFLRLVPFLAARCKPKVFGWQSTTWNVFKIDSEFFLRSSLPSFFFFFSRTFPHLLAQIETRVLTGAGNP